MPIFIVEAVADSPIREFWQIEAGSHQEARAMFSDGHCGKFLWDEVMGEETNRDISEVHTFADLASTIALHNAQQEGPAMLAALRKISQGADCFMFNSDADVFRFVDMVAEAVAPILARIDGAAPAPTAQPAVAIGEAGGGVRGLLFDIRDFLAGFEDCEDNGELVRGLQERIARATEGEA